MKIEKFTAILQDSLNSLDKYLKLLVEKSYRLSVIDKVKEYSLNIKKNIAEQYNGFGSEIQLKLKSRFNEFSDKCDKMMNSAIDNIKQNYNIVVRCNDPFYNETLFPNSTEQN